MERREFVKSALVTAGMGSGAAFGAEPVHAMGESIGGTIALAAGLRHPSRFASVAMSNAAIMGGQIGYAPGWRAE